MKSNLLKITFISLLTLFSSLAHSAPVTFTFQTNLLFDPTLTVGGQGQTVADVFDAIYGSGIGATGEIQMSGSLTYDDSTPVNQQFAADDGSGGAGSFLAPITGLQLNIGGATVNANIASINANNNLSSQGVGIGEVDATPEFCFGDFADCQASTPGLAMIRTSNAAGVINSALPAGEARDTIVFGLGFTGAANDFTPALSVGAPNPGGVFVDSFTMLLQSKLSVSLVNDHTRLPSTNTAFNVSNFEFAQIGVGFRGTGIDGFDALGFLSVPPPEPVVVPVPAAVWLFVSGLVGLAGVARCKKV